ncbi:MAG: DUF4870 domain-containing protein [Xanthomonadaceae bacterium]|jgi:uncharacterized Tic20 family protein|nr:DUF4870 domain-containing protein [Xanthomonadaceae bacterium]
MTNEVSQDDKTMAMIAFVLGIPTSWIGPLIIWLINKDKTDKPFTVDQSKEVLNFEITIVIAWVVIFILAMILIMISPKLAMIGSLLYMIVGLANLVLCIMGAISANKGVKYRFPFALRLIK